MWSARRWICWHTMGLNFGQCKNDGRTRTSTNLRVKIQDYNKQISTWDSTLRPTITFQLVACFDSMRENSFEGNSNNRPQHHVEHSAVKQERLNHRTDYGMWTSHACRCCCMSGSTAACQGPFSTRHVSLLKHNACISTLYHIVHIIYHHEQWWHETIEKYHTLSPERGNRSK